MPVADGDRQCVRRVVRLRRLFQSEHGRDHANDLLLLRPAVADDRLLDLERRIFADFQPVLSCGKQCTPRASATTIAVVALVLKNSSSIAICSGL